MQNVLAFLEVSTFLNARHYVVLGGRQGPVHPHAWRLQAEVAIPLEMLGDDGVGIGYAEMEQMLRRALAPYEGTLLNEVSPFDRFQPSTENIARVLFDTIAQEAAAARGQLVALSLWESPSKGVTLRRATPPADLRADDPGPQLLRVAPNLFATETGLPPVAAAEATPAPPAPAETTSEPALAPLWTPRLIPVALALALVAALGLRTAVVEQIPQWPPTTNDPIWWTVATALGAVGWLGLRPLLGAWGAALAGVAWSVLPLAWNALMGRDLAAATALAVAPWLLAVFRQALLTGGSPVSSAALLLLIAGTAALNLPAAALYSLILLGWVLARRNQPGAGALLMTLAPAALAALLAAWPTLVDDPLFAPNSTPLLTANWLLGPGRSGPAPAGWVAAVPLAGAAMAAVRWRRLSPWTRDVAVLALTGGLLALPPLSGIWWAGEWLGRLLFAGHLLPLAAAAGLIAATAALQDWGPRWVVYLPALGLLLASGMQGPLLEAPRLAALPGPGPAGGRTALVGAGFPGGSVALAAADQPARLAPGDGKVVPGGRATLGAVSRAWDQGHYSYLTDRLLELGVTDILVPSVAAAGQLGQVGAAAGYTTRTRAGEWTWLSRTPGPAATLATYPAMAIGPGAGDWALVFPAMAVGESPDLADYTLGELTRYRTVILAGARWQSAGSAETLVRQLAGSNVNVLVDMTRMPGGLLSRRPEFLGVGGTPVPAANGSAPVLVNGGAEVRVEAALRTIPTFYALRGVDQEVLRYRDLGPGAAAVGVRKLPEGPIWLLGAPLAAYAADGKDPAATQVLAQLTGLTPGAPPARRLVSVRRLPGDDRVTQLLVDVPADVQAAEELVLPVGARPGLAAEVDGLKVPWASRHGLVRIPAVPGVHAVRLATVAPPWWASAAEFALTLMAAASWVWVTLRPFLAPQRPTTKARAL